jgi:hypothetical protein
MTDAEWGSPLGPSAFELCEDSSRYGVTTTCAVPLRPALRRPVRGAQAADGRGRRERAASMSTCGLSWTSTSVEHGLVVGEDDRCPFLNAMVWPVLVS